MIILDILFDHNWIRGNSTIINKKATLKFLDFWVAFCYFAIDFDAFFCARFSSANSILLSRINAFWFNAELNLLKALVLYVSLEMPPEKRNFGTVYDMLIHEDERSLKKKMLSIRGEHVNPFTGEVMPPSPAFAPFALFIVQAIPSPKAEPFKLWLAQVGRERIEETIDPELTIERALETYLKKGYTREWINQRLQAIQVRKELTDEWDSRGVQKGVEYAILTDEISRAWSGMSTRQYKNLKGLKKENLRDNMTTLELVLNMLAEATTTEISKQKAPTTFSENMAIAREGGEVAGIARKAAEERTGVPVITSKNAAQLNQVVTNLLEGVVADNDDDSGESQQ